MNAKILISFIIIISACSNQPIEDKEDTISNLKVLPTIDIESEDSINSLEQINDRFRAIRESVPGELLFDSVWTINRTKTYMTLVSKAYSYEKEFGGIYINHWKWGKEKPEFQWSYSDTLSCGWQDVVVKYDLNSLIITQYKKQDVLVIIYTLDCTTDVSPSARFLIILNTEGKILLKLNGWTSDPASNTDFSMYDFKYNPKTDDYNPHSPEGKIENYHLLENLTPQEHKKILEIWKTALVNAK